MYILIVENNLKDSHYIYIYIRTLQKKSFVVVTKFPVCLSIALTSYFQKIPD